MDFTDAGVQILIQGGAITIALGLIIIILKLIEKRNTNGNGKNSNGSSMKCALDPQVLSAFAEAAKATSERSDDILKSVNNAVTAIAVFTEKVDSLNNQIMRCFDRQEANGRDLREIYDHLANETGNTLSAVERELVYVQETQAEMNGKLDMAVAVSNVQPTRKPRAK